MGLPSIVGSGDTKLIYVTIAVERKARLGRVNKCILVDMIMKKMQPRPMIWQRLRKGVGGDEEHDEEGVCGQLKEEK
ncbi:hypothetical protein AMTR_s00002p00190640 [Amborella trichopoda]|uniref:Uncharacterized protein n=1 Tax=Amborella trichopoda TaxID=13333 RepID=W1NZJ1_AMBTC|nr:hypothetical protein AMTR_s00002p00190640 [Amborella trichopoda]